jgi:cell division protein FtsB
MSGASSRLSGASSRLSGRPLPRKVVVLVLSALTVAGLGVGANGVMRIVAMQREIALIEADLGKLGARTQELTAMVQKLRNDPLFIEKLAREDLGYVRPGEEVLKFPSQPR